MTAYARVRKSDGMVTGTTIVTPEQAAKFPTDAFESLEEITQAQYEQTLEGFTHPGSSIPKFSWDGSTALDPTIRYGTLIENPDTRPTVTFTPTEIKAEVGDVVTVDLSHDGLDPGSVELELLLAGMPMRIAFLDGQATVTINTDNPMRFSVVHVPQFRVAAPLLVTIYTRKLGQVG